MIPGEKKMERFWRGRGLMAMRNSVSLAGEGAPGHAELWWSRVGEKSLASGVEW